MSLFRKPLRIEAVWRRLAALTAHTGDPSGVAHLRVLSRRYRQMVLSWLRPLEAIARRLLLLEALALPAPPQRVERMRRKLAAPSRTPCLTLPPNPHHPARWPARFRILAEPPRKRTYEARARKSADQPAMPLARRIEALRRVIADRQPAVRRLARLLHVRAQVVRAGFRLLRRGASYQRSGALLRVVHARVIAAAGWDSS